MMFCKPIAVPVAQRGSISPVILSVLLAVACILVAGISRNLPQEGLKQYLQDHDCIPADISRDRVEIYRCNVPNPGTYLTASELRSAAKTAWATREHEKLASKKNHSTARQ